jgi:hypothetical protein
MIFRKKPQDDENRNIREIIGQYSLILYGIVCGVVIILLIILAGYFSSQERISVLAFSGFFCSSIGTAIALYVGLFSASRRWLIWAFMLFVFGMFFQLFTLIPS